MKTAVVTGANGFVGSAVVNELSSQGVTVYAVVKDTSEDLSSIKKLSNVHIVYCDLKNIAQLSQLIADKSIDVFYHFAWVGSAGLLRGDYQVQLANAQYTCNAIISCKQLGCLRFIFAASIMEYECIELMKTDALPSMNMMYNTGKIAADFMAKTLCAKENIHYISVIISNIYGAGERSPRLINSSILKILKKEKTEFTPGTQMYDFIYITDAANAFYMLGNMQSLKHQYYLGSANPRPLRDFLIEMKNCVDASAEIGLGEIPFSGVSMDYTQFDLYALGNDTGFKPIVSFSQGIQMTTEWLKSGE